MRIDGSTRDLVYDYFDKHKAHYGIRFIKPPEQRGMSVGVPQSTLEITHLYTGIKITVPPEASRSDIKRQEIAMAMFSIIATMLDCDPETLN